MKEQIAVKDYIPNVKIKSCCDCYYMRAAHSWWCVSKGANEAFGTMRTAGNYNCSYWKACRTFTELSLIEKMFMKIDVLWICFVPVEEGAIVTEEAKKVLNL